MSGMRRLFDMRPEQGTASSDGLSSSAVSTEPSPTGVPAPESAASSHAPSSGISVSVHSADTAPGSAGSSGYITSGYSGIRSEDGTQDDGSDARTLPVILAASAILLLSAAIGITYRKQKAGSSNET
jgi:hypothetical protein